MRRVTDAEVKKHNGRAVSFLTKKLREIPPNAMARLTNAALKAALQNTYQDSGRFGWNWNVQWSGKTRGGHGAEYGVSPVGLQGDARGAGDSKVIQAQKKQMGFNMSAFSKGKLAEAIMEDNPDVVRIFNPFYRGKYGEHAAGGKGGTVTKEKVPDKIEAAIAREAARVNYELNYRGGRE